MPTTRDRRGLYVRHTISLEEIQSVADGGPGDARKVAALLIDHLRPDAHAPPTTRGVEVYHRFGGHGGISTEWELEAEGRMYADVLKALGPVPPLVQVSMGDFGCSIVLPEGVPYDLAGKVAGLWSARREDVVGLERMHYLLRRCQMWGAAFIRHLPIRMQWCRYWADLGMHEDIGGDPPKPPQF